MTLTRCMTHTCHTPAKAKDIMGYVEALDEAEQGDAATDDVTAIRHYLAVLAHLALAHDLDETE